MRLIDADELIQHTYSAVIDGVETDIIDVSNVDNAPTVKAISLSDDFLSYFRIDDNGKALVLTDKYGYTRALKILPYEEKQCGKWEEPFEHNGKIYHKCNRCHASIPLMLIDNYCSYCGAEMVGGIKNETDN